MKYLIIIALLFSLSARAQSGLVKFRVYEMSFKFWDAANEYPAEEFYKNNILIHYHPKDRILKVFAPKEQTYYLIKEDAPVRNYRDNKCVAIDAIDENRDKCTVVIEYSKDNEIIQFHVARQSPFTNNKGRVLLVLIAMNVVRLIN